MSTFSMNGSPTCTDGSFLRPGAPLSSPPNVSDASTDTPPMPSRPVRAPNRMILLPGAGRERQVQILLAQHPDAERIDQRVARIGGVEHGLAADVRQAQRVSVSADAADHAVDDAAGVGRVGRAEPQLVHHRHRAGAHRHDVADDAADAGGRALVRLDVGRVVVGLHLEGGRPAVADVDDAGVLADAREHPVAHRLGGGLAEVAQMHLRGLVGAVLAPHHRVHRQFGVGGPTAEDLADPLVLVVLEAEFADAAGAGREWRRRGRRCLQHSGRGLAPTSRGQSSLRSYCQSTAQPPGDAEGVAVGVGQDHPVEVGTEAVAGRSPRRPARRVASTSASLSALWKSMWTCSCPASDRRTFWNASAGRPAAGRP